MLKPDLIHCSSCQSILDVLCNIDEKLTQLAKNHYTNIIYETNEHYPKDVVYSLLNYKRIMTSKLFNPSYTDYKQSVLISRIKALLNG